MNQNIYALLPHRGVDAGKSRLAGSIDAPTRSALNRWLLERTIHVVSAWLGDTTRCMIISPCERTLALARVAGATALQELASAQGLNAALAQGAAHAATAGAQRLLILPCDLPYLNGAALDALRSPADSATEMAIAADRHEAGTNALLVSASMREFNFGVNSYARHAAQAGPRGMRVLPITHAALAFDLDTADDYLEWLNSGQPLPAFISAPSSGGAPQSRA